MAGIIYSIHIIACYLRGKVMSLEFVADIYEAWINHRKLGNYQDSINKQIK